MATRVRGSLAAAFTIAVTASILMPGSALAVPDAWSAVGPNGASPALTDDVYALYPSDDGVLVGGLFANAGGGLNARDSFARWTGSAWESIGDNGSGNGYFDDVGDYINAIAMIGDDIYAAGFFDDASGDTDADNIAMWDDSAGQWESLGPGLGSGVVRALAVNGNTLYAAGDFVNVDGDVTIDYLAKWNGSNWSNVGSFGGDGALNHTVRTLAVKNGTLFAGGDFTEADGDNEADYVAKFDGTNWVQLGGSGGIGALNRPVYSMVVDGPDVIVGGDFDAADGVADTAHVARWGGGAWSAIGANGDLSDDVLALTTDGVNIYAAGRFLDAGGHTAGDRVAMWDGNSWEALPDGVGNRPFGNTVDALAVWEGDLFAGGEYVDGATIAQADYLASWGLPLPLQPDGRVRNGAAGGWTGNNIYNTSGQNQKKTQTGGRNALKDYQISVQNDSPSESETFTVLASAASTNNYTITYFNGAANITGAVTLGGWVTPVIAPGAQLIIDVEVQYNNAPANSKVTRVITITSDGDSSKQDAVKIVAKR